MENIIQDYQQEFLIFIVVGAIALIQVGVFWGAIAHSWFDVSSFGQ